MLFTRRKAEIEILCAAASVPGPNLACGEEQNEDEDYVAPRQRENTLVQYLVAKIGKAVDSCGARSREV